jgi:hypothetical protein
MRESAAQEFAYLAPKDLADTLSDDGKFSILQLNLDLVRTTLIRILFIALKAQKFADLSPHTVSKDYAVERADYFKLIAAISDPSVRSGIVTSLRNDTSAAQLAEAVGKASIPSAQKMVAALNESTIIVPKMSPELVRSVVAFSQTAAVLQKATTATPIHCRYFPFSYFCTT